MTISAKTRKMLWGKAASRCAICRHSLVIDKTADDNESVVGEECHIISESVGGPRNNFMRSGMLFDEYDNLILLCSIHHKMIDDQYETYTPDILVLLKKKHEAWVNQALKDEKNQNELRIRRIKENIPKCLIRIDSAQNLLRMLDRCCVSYQTLYDNLSDEQVEVGGHFLQVLQDTIDLYGMLEPVDMAQTIISLRSELRELEKQGLYAFAALEEQVLEGGIGQPTVWKALHISVIRSDDPAVQVLGGKSAL